MSQNIVHFVVLLIHFLLCTDGMKHDNMSSLYSKCVKLQSMLSYSKYQTFQIPSNITHESISSIGQHFLTFSPTHDILVFLEARYQMHVYHVQTMEFVCYINAKDVVSAVSYASLNSEFEQNLYLMYETRFDKHTIILRVCQVQFDKIRLNFDNKLCIQQIYVQFSETYLRIYGFTLRFGHAETNNSILIISTEVGLIYTKFNRYTGSLIDDPMVMNETLSEGSVVFSSSNSVYYASKQENAIYELSLANDFYLYHGKVLKTNAIKQPFGLIIDECNHLYVDLDEIAVTSSQIQCLFRYITTRSMILIMFASASTTIRSVFSKASDLPIILERINSTTYVYTTIKRSSSKVPAYWIFNFLHFSEPDKNIRTNRLPIEKWYEQTELKDVLYDNSNISKLWPLSHTSQSPIKQTQTNMFTTTTIYQETSPSKQSVTDLVNGSYSIDISKNNSNEQKKLVTSNSKTISSNQTERNKHTNSTSVTRTTNGDSELSVDHSLQPNLDKQMNMSHIQRIFTDYSIKPDLFKNNTHSNYFTRMYNTEQDNEQIRAESTLLINQVRLTTSPNLNVTVNELSSSIGTNNTDTISTIRKRPIESTPKFSSTTLLAVQTSSKQPRILSTISSFQASLEHQLSTKNISESNQTITMNSLVIHNSQILSHDSLLKHLVKDNSTSTNSSKEQRMYLNLTDLPATSWSFSVNSTDNINLGIELPTDLNSTINITFKNIFANSFSTDIIGMPIRLQVDQVEAKQFSLKVNVTDHDLSQIVIGHVKSENFQLDLTKIDNMHVYMKQVDSATAELYLDNHFCSDNMNFEINLNVSKNGIIRYGNQTPIHIGPVFTRVHTRELPCDYEQPLILFFDICQRDNPCVNGGTCLFIKTNDTDILDSNENIGHIAYKCHCPLYTSGDHCQHLQYPFGYCLNNGTLFYVTDKYNQAIEQCNCLTGYRGEHCEENIDNCVGINCSNHGICHDDVNAHKCLCYDGYYGNDCEQKTVETFLLQVANKSFATIAIMLILSIMLLIVASDIHTYWTRKQNTLQLLYKTSCGKSELFENTVLLIGFQDIAFDMKDLSSKETVPEVPILKGLKSLKTIAHRRRRTYRLGGTKRRLKAFL